MDMIDYCVYIEANKEEHIMKFIFEASDIVDGLEVMDIESDVWVITKATHDHPFDHGKFSRYGDYGETRHEDDLEAKTQSEMSKILTEDLFAPCTVTDGRAK